MPAIRSTMAAVPRRVPVLWGKALVFGATALAISLPATFIVFLVGQAILSGEGINVSIGHPGVFRALIGAPLFLTAMGLFGLALGAILRSTAGGIAALAGIVFVLPPIVGLLPTSVANSVDPYLPSNAGGAIWMIGSARSSRRQSRPRSQRASERMFWNSASDSSPLNGSLVA